MNPATRERAFISRVQPLLSALLFNAGESGELVAELRELQHEATEILNVKPSTTDDHANRRDT